MELKRWVSCSRNWLRNCLDSSAFFKALWILLGISDEIVSTWPYQKQKQQLSDKIFITFLISSLPSKYMFVLIEVKTVNQKLQKVWFLHPAPNKPKHEMLYVDMCWEGPITLAPYKHLWVCFHEAQWGSSQRTLIHALSSNYFPSKTNEALILEVWVSVFCKTSPSDSDLSLGWESLTGQDDAIIQVMSLDTVYLLNEFFL